MLAKRSTNCCNCGSRGYDLNLTKQARAWVKIGKHECAALINSGNQWRSSQKGLPGDWGSPMQNPSTQPQTLSLHRRAQLLLWSMKSRKTYNSSCDTQVGVTPSNWP